MGYSIGSWNLRTFTGNEEKRDIDMIANIIFSENFHIVALQEIMSTKNIMGSQVLESLKKRLPGWDGSIGNFYSRRYGFNVEDYGFGFLWNSRFFQKAPDEGRITDFERFGSVGQISRDPVYMRFIPKNGPFIEIRLINVHIEYRSNSAQDKQKRIEEFKHITGQIHNSINTHRYGNFRPAYTIVMGDYNLTAVICQINEGKDSVFYAQTKQGDETTISKNGYANDYDHFSYNEERFAGIHIKMQRIDSVRKYMNNDFEKHKKMLSDHVPIKLEFELNTRKSSVYAGIYSEDSTNKSEE